MGFAEMAAASAARGGAAGGAARGGGAGWRGGGGDRGGARGGGRGGRGGFGGARPDEGPPDTVTGAATTRAPFWHSFLGIVSAFPAAACSSRVQVQAVGFGVGFGEGP